MGREIYYCSVCREQIHSTDLDSGRAFCLENRHFCLNCGPEVLRTLPKDKVKDIFTAITTSAKAFSVLGPETPRAAAARLPRATLPSQNPWVIPGAAAAVAAVALIVWLISSRPSAPDPAPPAPVARPVVRPPTPPPPEKKPEPVRPPDPKPVPPPVALPPSADKERIAREAIQKAREWAAANPSDFDGAVRKFQDATFLATGTSFMAEANKDLELYRQKQRDFFTKEFSALEPEVKAACAEERFMKALDLLRLAKDRYGSAEWQLLVGKRVREVNDSAFQLLNRVKDDALDAQGRGDEEKVKSLRARVASWGVERFAKEFRDAVDK